MTTRRLWPIILGMVAAVVYAVWALGRDDGEDATLTDKLGDGFWDIINAISKGERITYAPYSKKTGMVPGKPADLAAALGVPVDTYSLARLIASEEGLSSAATQAAVGWAVRNHAERSGKSITAVLIAAKYAPHSGYYGTQRNIEVGTPNGPNPETGFKGGSDRYASTANDFYAGHLAVATGIMAGTIPDITQGADQFDRPAAESNPEAVAANREASGSEEVDLSDYVDEGLRFWRKI